MLVMNHFPHTHTCFILVWSNIHGSCVGFVRVVLDNKLVLKIHESKNYIQHLDFWCTEQRADQKLTHLFLIKMI